jgi:hypothetical protein
MCSSIHTAHLRSLPLCLVEAIFASADNADPDTIITLVRERPFLQKLLCRIWATTETAPLQQKDVWIKVQRVAKERDVSFGCTWYSRFHQGSNWLIGSIDRENALWAYHYDEIGP